MIEFYLDLSENRGYRKRALSLMVATLIVVFLISCTTSKTFISNNIVQTSHQGLTKDKSRIQALIPLLEVDDDTAPGDERGKAVKARLATEQELIFLANKSPQLRQDVISLLSKSVQAKQELNGNQFGIVKTFLLWHSVSFVLGELKAIEAFDLLINCIHCSNLLSGSLEEAPALGALVTMGLDRDAQVSTTVIINLEQNLNNTYALRRVYIARCLGIIGNPRAKNALTAALVREQNSEVKTEIRRALYLIQQKNGITKR